MLPKSDAGRVAFSTYLLGSDTVKRTVLLCKKRRLDGQRQAGGIHDMKIKSKKWKFLLGVVFLILLVPLTYVVTAPILKPWARWEADRRVAEWERLKAEGLGLRRARKYDESESRLKQALAYAEEVLLVQPSRVASSAFALGGLYLVQERFDEARTCFERDLQISEELDGPSSPALVPTLAGE